MGVTGLTSRLKAIASERVDLNHGMGTIVYDGHASMHRSASRGAVAVEFVLKGKVTALVLGMLPEMLQVEQAGWDVVVVFDGATPPGKARASSSRSGERTRAMETCRHLQAQRPVNRSELEKHATRAAEFTPTIVARVAQMLRYSLRADCITAPFEADSQLRVMEGLYSGSGRRCFVRGNDSDLTVLGVRSVLWDVNMEDGGLVGQCIRLASVLQPRGGVFSNSSIQYDFLRRLHGVGTSASDEHAAPAWSTDGQAVMARLRNFACVAGNDYSKFKGIGPMRAMDIAIPCGNALSTLDVAVALAENTSSQTEVVLPQLKTSMDMFCHAVVWDPLTGTHRHLSGVESSADITSNTGALVCKT